MLTYEALRKLVQEEKTSNKLAELPEDFFENIRSYLDKKASISHEKEDVWELDSARRTLQDLLEIRERKILILALYNVRSGVVSVNMTPEEKQFFDRLVEGIKEFQARRKELLDGKPEKRRIVALLEDMPEFVAINMKIYGPYRKGDVATIPEENAKLLVEKGIARIIETGTKE
jgi:DNA replication factor GINS